MHHYMIDSSDKIGSVAATVSSEFANSSGKSSSGISSTPRDFNFSFLLLKSMSRLSRPFCLLAWSLGEMRDLAKRFLNVSSLTS